MDFNHLVIFSLLVFNPLFCSSPLSVSIGLSYLQEKNIYKMSLAHGLLNAVGQALSVVIELKEVSSFPIIPNEDEIGDRFRLVIQILSKILKIVVFFYLPFLSPFLILTSLHHSLITTKCIFYDTLSFSVSEGPISVFYAPE